MKKNGELKVVECRGTPYEIGCQYGEACRDSLRGFLDMSLMGLYLGFKAEREQVLFHAREYIPLVEAYDPELVEMLKGQSAGSGIPFEQLIALRSIFELAIYYPKISGLCTSFAVSGEAVKDGKTILGQNIDWAPWTPIELLKIYHHNGLVQLSLSLGGAMEYTLSSAGFGICANATFGSEYSIGVSLGCYLPKVMRQKTAAEAMEVLKQVVNGLGYYHLAGSNGFMAGIESVPGDYEIINPKRNILVHSNHYLTERFKGQDLVNMAIPDSLNRVSRISSLIEHNYGRLTVETMMEILADHDNQPNSICRHVDTSKPPLYHSETLASFVEIPEDGVMYICLGNPCSNEYLEYHI